jgi:hypothetical protein
MSCDLQQVIVPNSFSAQTLKLDSFERTDPSFFITVEKYQSNQILEILLLSLDVISRFLNAVLLSEWLSCLVKAALQ